MHRHIVRHLIRTLTLLTLLAGCQGQTRVFDNPVVGPPPPRISGAEVQVAAQDSPTESASAQEPAPFRLLEYTKPTHASEEVPVTGPPGLVAARVNGTPIFLAEVLQPYAPQLEQLRAEVRRGRLQESEFRQLQMGLVKRDLPNYIETAVLVDRVLTPLDAEQKAGIQKQLDEIFDEQIAEMMRQAGVTSLPELEAKLAEAGSSLTNELQASGSTLAELRDSFGRRALSTQYLREAIGAEKNVTRGELLAEYQASIEEFSTPARVKWQQIRISYDRHGGREGARRILAQALGELRIGESFDDLARKYSDEILATQGGHWDWTQPESLSDEQLRGALQSTDVDEVADPIENDKAFLVVRVTGKQAAATKPFAEVQNELRQRIAERRRQEQLDKVLADAMADAVIETLFDGEVEDGERQVSPVSGEKTASSR